MRSILRALACAAALAPLACGSGSLSSPDGASGGMCGANVPAGQACNTLANIAPAVTPTCVAETVPTGTGGTIVDGTYVLTSQTYYNSTGCSTAALRETITISGGCIQLVFGDIITATGSGTFAVQGNTFTSTQTCSDLSFDASTGMMDAPGSKTFTATPTMFTLFTRNSGTSSSNPDRVEVLTKQ